MNGLRNMSFNGDHDSATDSIKIQTSPISLLLAGIGVIYFVGLFNHGLIPSMEPRFAEVVTEMIAQGQYLVPTKNGIPYVEYPPLLYWLGIIGKTVGLPIEAAVRLPCYLAFILWIVLLAKLQGLLKFPHPKIALPLIGAASPAVLWHFFTAQTDALLIVGVGLAFLGFAEIRMSSPNSGSQWAAWWRLWGGIALAVLAKGPVGIACTMPPMGLELILAAWFSAETGKSIFRAVGLTWSMGLRVKPIRGLILITVLILPWYLISGIQESWDFIRAVIIYQNVERYTTGFDHLQPWWYYFGSVLAGFFPISFLIPAGIWFCARRRADFGPRLALIWGLWTFMFFSISMSKQGKYILPSAPAFLLLGFYGLEGLRNQGRALRWRGWVVQWSASVLFVWGLVVVVAMPALSERFSKEDEYVQIRAAMASQPGDLFHFGWPRSLSLFYLGAPMEYVRSSRELYQKISAREISAGSYILVETKRIPASGATPRGRHFHPLAASPWFEQVHGAKAGSDLQLYRVLPQAHMQSPPDTPDPEIVNWRDMKFDTD